MIFMPLHHVAYGEKAYFVVRLWGLGCYVFSIFFISYLRHMKFSIHGKMNFVFFFDSRMKEYSASDSKKCRYYRNGIMSEFGYSLLT